MFCKRIEGRGESSEGEQKNRERKQSNGEISSQGDRHGPGEKACRDTRKLSDGGDGGAKRGKCGQPYEIIFFQTSDKLMYTRSSYAFLSPSPSRRGL